MYQLPVDGIVDLPRSSNFTGFFPNGSIGFFGEGVVNGSGAINGLLAFLALISAILLYLLTNSLVFLNLVISPAPFLANACPPLTTVLNTFGVTFAISLAPLKAPLSNPSSISISSFQLDTVGLSGSGLIISTVSISLN